MTCGDAPGVPSALLHPVDAARQEPATPTSGQASGPSASPRRAPEPRATVDPGSVLERGKAAGWTHVTVDGTPDDDGRSDDEQGRFLHEGHLHAAVRLHYSPAVTGRAATESDGRRAPRSGASPGLNERRAVIRSRRVRLRVYQAHADGRPRPYTCVGQRSPWPPHPRRGMPGGRATEGMGASPRVLACARRHHEEVVT